MDKPSTFERFLFGLMRAFAIGGAFAAALCIGLSLLALGTDPGHVSVDELNTVTYAKDGGSVAAASNRLLFTPERVRGYLSGENEGVMKGWLDLIPDPEAKQDFLDNLNEVIVEAEQRDLDVLATINNYKTIKLDRINRGVMGEYAKAGRKVFRLGASLALALFFGLMCIVLLLLAIERNTRAAHSGASSPPGDDAEGTAVPET